VSIRSKWLFAIVIFIFFFRLIAMPPMGNYLVADHDLTEADAIVVLMGGPTTKIPEAADLYLAEYADQIIMAQTPHGSLEPDPETGILSAGETERSRLILINSGVPEEAIIIIPSMTKSTSDEAEAVRGYLEQRKDINSLILVTSSAHTRRAYIIFSRALETLDRDIELISRASRYDDSFQAEGWWRDGANRRLVFLEYQKIIYYYFLELFNKS
jgi:uncharacterized SAM-binding protein YcdF (DUF218 family)